MTGVVEIFVGLLLAVAVLALLARRLHIPYPILFVIGGLLLGLIPKLPKVRLDPDLVLLFVLPPLLFPAAIFTSWRDFRANLRPIALLAIGLVLFTTVAVAYLAHYFVGLGGIGVGLAVGSLAAQFHKRVDDAPIEITVSLLTPFAAYLAAERLGVSGVLAVVTAGLHLGWRLPQLLTFKTRLQGGPVWEMVEFLLNGFVFILIGLQLPEVLHGLSGRSVPHIMWLAIVMSLAVIAIRIAWVFPATYLPRLLFKSIRKQDPYPSWRHVS